MRETLARMQAAGPELQEIAVPAHEEMFAIFSAIVAAGAAALMSEPGTGGYAEGFTVDGAGFREAVVLRRAAGVEALGDWRRL